MFDVSFSWLDSQHLYLPVQLVNINGNDFFSAAVASISSESLTGRAVKSK